MWAEHGGWWMGVGIVHMLLFWGLIILAIVALVKWLSGKSPSPSAERLRERTALEILQERYARGEIDRQEYEQKRTDLLR